MIYFLSEEYLPFVHVSLVITAAWYLAVNVFKVFLLRMLAVTCESFYLNCSRLHVHPWQLTNRAHYVR